MGSKKIFFVTGIDTDAGKSIVTGTLARELARQGEKVITQKFIQTGCHDISEDIETHRRIMGIELLPEDRNGTTCPLIFSYPASPHLAAEMESAVIDTGKIAECSRRLHEKYDIILLEGAGGLLAPVSPDYLTIDYIKEHGLPVILVTSPRMGSINHTLLSLEACRAKDIFVHAIVYDIYFQTNNIITDDTRKYFKYYLSKYHPCTKFMEIDGEMRLYE